MLFFFLSLQRENISGLLPLIMRKGARFWTSFTRIPNSVTSRWEVWKSSRVKCVFGFSKFVALRSPTNDVFL